MTVSPLLARNRLSVGKAPRSEQVPLLLDVRLLALGIRERHGVELHGPAPVDAVAGEDG